MTTYYIFRGRGDCGSCSSFSGYYTVHPGRPHENCQCEIVVQDEKNCDGDWTASGLDDVRDLGNGYLEQDLTLDVKQPDGSVAHDIVTVTWPSNMELEDMLDVFEDVLEDAAGNLSEPCPPFLCC